MIVGAALSGLLAIVGSDAISRAARVEIMMRLLIRSACMLWMLVPGHGAALVAQVPGTILAQEPMSGAPAGVTAWRIRYRTGGRDGVAPQEATAVIMAPADAADRGPRKVVAWAHGTWGVASTCAPSQGQRFFEATPAVSAVAMGYVVVAPDYPGLGTATTHPYLIGQPTGQSVIDAVRAALAMPAVNAGRRYVVWGESQGGHAGLWTAMTAGTAPELELIGVAAGAPPTDLAANFREASDPNARAFLTALTADSWSRYFGIPLDIGRRRTPGIIRKLAGNCISSTATPRLGALVGMIALRSDLKNDDFAARTPWSRIMAENSASPSFSVPLLLAQTREDPLVSPKVTRTFARKACLRGLKVRWFDLPGKDHAATASQSAFATLQWIEDRFAGAPAPDDCSALR